MQEHSTTVSSLKFGPGLSVTLFSIQSFEADRESRSSPKPLKFTILSITASLSLSSEQSMSSPLFCILIKGYKQKRRKGTELCKITQMDAGEC